MWMGVVGSVFVCVCVCACVCVRVCVCVCASLSLSLSRSLSLPLSVCPSVCLSVCFVLSVRPLIRWYGWVSVRGGVQCTRVYARVVIGSVGWVLVLVRCTAQRPPLHGCSRAAYGECIACRFNRMPRPTSLAAVPTACLGPPHLQEAFHAAQPDGYGETCCAV
jgi:hypothetical protein